MNKKARIILSILALLLVALMVTACNRNGGGVDPAPTAPPAPAPPAPPAPTPPAPGPDPVATPTGTRDWQGLRPYLSTGNDTITVSMAEWMATYAEDGTAGVMMNALDQFRLHHPDINLEFQFANIGNDEAIIALVAAGDLPDVFFDIQRPLPFMITQGWLHPLLDFITDDDYEFHTIPDHIHYFRTFAGELWSLPGRSHANSGFIVINTTLMEELNLDMPRPDWTWDEFEQFIMAGATDQFAGIERLWSPEFLGVTLGREDIFGFNTATSRFDLTGDWIQAHNRLQHWTSVPNLEAFALRCQDDPFGNEDSDYIRKFGAGNIGDGRMAFMTGNVLTILGSSADRGWFQENWHLQEAPFDVVVHSIPQNPRYGLRLPLHAMHTVVTSTTQHPEAAFELARWLSYSEVGLRSIIHSFFFKPNVDNPNVWSAFEQYWADQMTPGLIYSLANFHQGGMIGMFPVIPDYGSIFDSVLNPANQEVFDGGDVHSIAAEATDRANAMVAEAIARVEAEAAAALAAFRAR